MVDASQMLGDVEQESCAATEQLTGVRGDDGAVLQLDGRRCVARLLLVLLGSHCGAAEIGAYSCLVEEHLYLAYLCLVACPACQFVGRVIVAAHYLVLRCLAAHIVVADAEAHHVDAHVGG